MNRRDFVKYLALVGAGLSAQPSQIAAFERYYEVNTPQTVDELVAVDEVFVSGIATCSTPIAMELFPSALSGGMNMALNAFGGIVRWMAPPDGKIAIRKSELVWSFTLIGREAPPFEDVATGYISYVCQDGKRINHRITDWTNRVAV